LGGRTVALENVFWHSLKEIARRHRMTVTALVEEINAQRRHSNLSSALRLFVLEFYRSQIPEPGDREGVTGWSALNACAEPAERAAPIRSRLPGHRRPFSRLSLSPADSFCDRAFCSMLRNCMTRSAS
jgi:predicted DNA-binding ribbon-helix-helix protein